jgi:CRP-like cAMP-binding protein
MSGVSVSPARGLLQHLRSITALSEHETRAVENLPVQVTDIARHQDIVREGDRPRRSCILMTGFACTFKMTGEGRRQIMAFHLSGDMPDLQSVHLSTLDSSLGSITACRVGFVEHEAIHKLCEDHPRIGSALWRMTLIDAAVFREWISNIGQRDGYSRVAHLLAETLVRSHAVGLARGHTCEMPFTQGDLGEATGMSTVHINRVLQELRRDELIRLERGTLHVLDWPGLKKAGDFDATYLHLRQESRLQ